MSRDVVKASSFLASSLVLSSSKRSSLSYFLSVQSLNINLELSVGHIHRSSGADNWMMTIPRKERLSSVGKSSAFLLIETQTAQRAIRLAQSPTEETHCGDLCHDHLCVYAQQRV
ncbi:hypothetical protein PoB_004642700 [Plakobranchus ocellatus]|uniref:Secreted protein n=1 Tax=Plakobranchus ocellatus TaxID=259542 RepID=A0AAV4BLX3_9GAST|nr:hypothetical protein PoB_004642700 [Plakobranchus ocellatus]